jgi:hypothetical protein
MVNYVASFIQNLSDITSPLRELMKKQTTWLWTDVHQKAIGRIKKLLTEAPVLAIYNPQKDVVIQTDSSKDSLGCCLLQSKRPVFYASRSLRDNEKQWGQIDKEFLAILYSCQKFHYFIYGKPNIIVHSDHKPLVSIMAKEMNQINSARLQKIKMKLLKYDITVQYVPGKEMHIADTLSRDPAAAKDDSDTNDDLGEMIHQLDLEHETLTIDMTDEKRKIFKICTREDPILSQIIKTYLKGWPETKEKVSDDIKFYWKFRFDLSVQDGIVFIGSRYVVPQSLRTDMLQQLHEGHFGISKMKSRAKPIMYWPNMDANFEEMVGRCEKCEKWAKTDRKEPMVLREIPSYPFQMVSCDIMEYAGKNYIVLIDFFSKWLDFAEIRQKTAGAVIGYLKSLFAVMGIPKNLLADNMPFSSREFITFSEEWNFKVITSSPNYPKSNGLAERAVQIAKNILRKCSAKDEITAALMAYRNSTPTGLSMTPAQINLGRSTKTKIPVTMQSLRPIWKGSHHIQDQLKSNQQKSKEYYDRGSKTRSDFAAGQRCFIRKDRTWIPATIVEKHQQPRSYIVQPDHGATVRRNSAHLKTIK